RVAHPAGGDPRGGRTVALAPGARYQDPRPPAADPACRTAVHRPDQRAAAAVAQRARAWRHRRGQGRRTVVRCAPWPARRQTTAAARGRGARPGRGGRARIGGDRCPGQPGRQCGEVHARGRSGGAPARERRGRGRLGPGAERGGRGAPVRARLSRHACGAFPGRRHRPVDRAAPVRTLWLERAGRAGAGQGRRRHADVLARAAATRLTPASGRGAYDPAVRVEVEAMPGSGTGGTGGRWRKWVLGVLCAHATACAAPATGAGGDEAALRQHMVERQLAGRGIDDARVLEAMRRVPRHRFVPEELAGQAYLDQPLPIGHDQTISQPYIVALMTQLARPQAGDRVLEIGTGSGYQTAVLAELAAEVYSIEIVTPLATRAALLLRKLGYSNFAVRSGDGYAGWPEHAPFD